MIIGRDENAVDGGWGSGVAALIGPWVVLLVGEVVAAAFLGLADRWPVGVFDAVAAAVLVTGSRGRLRSLAWVPAFAAVGYGVTWLPRLVLGFWIGGA